MWHWKWFSDVLAINARDVAIIRFISYRLWSGTIKPFSMSERNPKPCLKLRNPLNSVIYFPKFLSLFPWVSEDLLFLGPRVKNLSRSGDEIEKSAPRTPIFSSRDERHLQSVRYPGVKFFWSASLLDGMIPTGHDAALLPLPHPTISCWFCTSSVSCFKHPPRNQKRLWYFISL